MSTRSRQDPEIFTLIKSFKNEEAKQYLAEHPEEINLQGWQSDTPLHVAAGAGNLEMLKFLAENGANINAGPDATPLCLAADAAIAGYLLERGATMYNRELEYATRCNRIEVIARLLDAGARINMRDPQFLYCQSVESISVYLQHGIDISTSGEKGETLLHNLAWANLPEVFDYAYSNGCGWKKDNFDREPYDMAFQVNTRAILHHLRTNYGRYVAHEFSPLQPHEYRTLRIHSAQESKQFPGKLLTLEGGGWRPRALEERFLVRYAIEKDRLICEKVVKIKGRTGLCFTFNQDWHLVLPTGDDELLLIHQESLELICKISLPGYTCIDTLIWLPGKQFFIAISMRRRVLVLNAEFEIILDQPCNYGISLIQVNTNETLLAGNCWTETEYYTLHEITEELEINEIEAYFKDGQEGFGFNGNEMAVVSSGLLEYYSFQNGQLEKNWELKISSDQVDVGRILFVDSKHLLVGRGKRLWLIDTEGRNVIREFLPGLKGEIRSMSLIGGSDLVLVSTAGREYKILSIADDIVFF